MLYLNTVGSRDDAPETHYRAVDNLYFAVGTKDNPITIATVECAVYGGLQAAQALWRRSPHSHHNTIMPVTPILPHTYDPLFLWTWKIILAPWAVAAKCWSDTQTFIEDAAIPHEPAPNVDAIERLAPLSVAVDALLQTAMASITASFAFWTGFGKLLVGGSPEARSARHPR